MKIQHDDAAQGVTGSAVPGEKPPPLVLVVDDSREIREFIALLVRLCGYRVLKAADGLAAQNILMTEHPVLVISDLEMPVCDGWEMLAYCHAQHPGLPVLIVSGADWGKRPEIERWAAGFIPKPFPVERFRTEIERLVCLAA
jgi:DNA-binding NtrC family response regulator